MKEKIKNIIKSTVTNKKWLAVAILIVGAAIFLFVRNSNSEPEVINQTATVKRGTIISSVSASGQVLSVNIMSANTKASGIVKRVYVKDGDQVKNGDKILEIDLDFQGEQKNASAWSSYLSAKNSLESAKATQYSLQSEMLSKWDTFKELAESDDYKDTDSDNRNLPEFHIPEKDWLAAEAKYKNQEAVITQAQAAINSNWLEYKLTAPVITAPSDGTITSLMYAEGMSIGSLDTGASTSNQKVANIQTEGMPIVSVNLSEIDASQVKLGKKATIILDSIPDKTFTGEVVGVDRIGEITSGVTQYPAIIQLDSSAEEILPNMTVTANIIVETKSDVLTVPLTAINYQGETASVTVVKNGQEINQTVELGISSDTAVEILSGTSEGDVVVTGTTTTSSKSTEKSTGRGIIPVGGGSGSKMMMP